MFLVTFDMYLHTIHRYSHAGCAETSGDGNEYNRHSNLDTDEADPGTCRDVDIVVIVHTSLMRSMDDLVTPPYFGHQLSQLLPAQWSDFP